MKTDNDNDILKKIIEDNIDLFEDDIKDDIPDFSKITKVLDDFENGLEEVNKIRRRNMFIRWLSLAATIAAIAVIGIFSFTHTADANGLKIFDSFTKFFGKFVNVDYAENQDDLNGKLKEVSDYRQNVSIISSIEKAKEQIDIPFIIPEYITNGYDLRNIEYRKYSYDRYLIAYKYFKDNKILLRIEQSLNYDNSFTTDNNYNEISLDNKNCYYVNNPNGSRNIYFQDGTRLINILTFEPDDEVEEIIKNLREYRH